MRYNRIAADLGIPEDKLKANMMFTTDKIGDTLTVAMRPADAEKWFGIQPPDLSVIARSRGEDWLYSYLQGFYADPSRPTGMNNLYLPGVSMPHVLWELQGIQRAVHHKSKDAHGNEVDTIELTPDIPGKLSDVQYRREIRDLVNFLVYVGEPAKLVRYQLGFRVLLFLTVLLVVVYLMKREYWKDVY
jgi:ubiquinol-cytochrome c reductase cytochrome c1 subunit